MTAPEFSRPVRIDSLPPDEAVYDIAAEPEECSRLAERLGLVALESLSASVRLERRRKGMVALHADFEAAVVQSCVVTLEPVPAAVRGAFERLYDPAEPAFGPEEEELGEDEPPDPLIDGVIDIGEAVAEQLALDLDPFPRAPDAAFDGFSTATPEQEEEMAPPNPFAALARLKDGKDGT